MPQAELVVAGRLPIGKDGEHQISSPLETDEAVHEYAENVKGYHVKVGAAERKCAVCIDGRGCRCTAADVAADGTMPEYKQAPIRPKMAGGLRDMATMMALLGKWHALGEATTYQEAYDIVGQFLADNGYSDAAHTSDVSFESSETTECGAWMKKTVAMQNGAAMWEALTGSSQAGALDSAVAAMNGTEADAFMTRRNYQLVRERQAELVASGIFGTFDPVKQRDALRRSIPEALEVLYSDPNHPTHKHEEPLFLINEVEGTTIDRDAMYQHYGAAPFVDDRWLRRELAGVMSGGSQEEYERLLLAGDVTTVDISHELIGRDFPVGVLREPLQQVA